MAANVNPPLASSVTARYPKQDALRLSCMEIWGGSGAAQQCVSTPGLDLWVYSRPYENAAEGGDVHYVSVCGGGAFTRVMLADVAGHGAIVGELAGALRNLMRRFINDHSQRRLVQALNRQFGHVSTEGRFASAVVGTFDPYRKSLALCNAGHPRPLLFRAASKRWSYVDACRRDTTDPARQASGNGSVLKDLPFGIDADGDYNIAEIDLRQGDVLLFYTDALIEAETAADGMLGEHGLLAIVGSLDTGDLPNLSAALAANIRAYRGGLAADDDLSFLLLHCNAGRPTPLTWRQKLDVYAKVFRLKQT